MIEESGVKVGYPESDIDVDEQVQEEKPKIDLMELAFAKFCEIKEQRANVPVEDGRRLIRIPLDSLEFETLDEFRTEALKIQSKTSRLTASQRGAVQGIINSVIWEMMTAKEESSKDEGAEVEVVTSDQSE